MYTYYLPSENGDGERCFSVEAKRPLTNSETAKLAWLLAGPDQVRDLSKVSRLHGDVFEAGPRVEIETPTSSNIVDICQGIKLPVLRVEESRRIRAEGDFDQMTECAYLRPLRSFKTNTRPEPVRAIRVSLRGRAALIEINKKLGLGWDDWHLEFVYWLITKILRRDPTDAELFMLAQMNSEHSRHWFFKSLLILDGIAMPYSLMDLIKAPLRAQIAEGRTNSISAFSDDSSAIAGFRVPYYMPRIPGMVSEIVEQRGVLHIVWTAETHNHPTFICPYQGAATCVGGLLRDLQVMRRGAMVGWLMAGYAVGCLNLEDHIIPGETVFNLPKRFANPRRVMIEGSNGVARYANEFGVPTIGGFARSFGQEVSGNRWEYLKPIMFGAAGGTMTDAYAAKAKPKKGMLVVMIGGPQYPVGIGGGSASSMSGGANNEALDFASVQRANAVEERGMEEVITACALMGKESPIASAHDQGAGGPGNVLAEIVSPAGATIDIRKIRVGDRTMGVLKITSAEGQERNAMLIWRKKLSIFRAICEREGVGIEVLGKITENGKIVFVDSRDGTKPIDLPLGPILENVPRKKFRDVTVVEQLVPFDPPSDSIRDLLRDVFYQPAVGSKQFLTRKKDRSVGGRVVRQQACGPLQLPVADVGVVALSHRTLRGAASAVGEQPTKMLVDIEAGTRMSIAETFANIMWAPIHGGIGNLKCSVNWMWPAKEPGEAVKLYRAARALSEFINVIRGMQPDGGKDSLAMVVKILSQIVKSPGTVVISAYGPVSDIRKVITPDIKLPGETRIGFVDLGGGNCRLGGSALAQSRRAIGNESPDADPIVIGRAFALVQEMIARDLILSGHDRSDGGLITLLAEMAMAGASGMKLRFADHANPTALLFNEEPGFAIEYMPEQEDEIDLALQRHGFEGLHCIGETTVDRNFSVKVGGCEVLNEDTRTFRNWWEATSDRLEEEQMDPSLVRQMRESPHRHEVPKWKLTFVPREIRSVRQRRRAPSVAVVRAKGTNGYQEMRAAFKHVGFRVVDVHMRDFLTGKATLDDFRGAAFPGGFSYADVLGSGKGQAALVKFNPRLREMFDRFFAREDTFSLGVCNGCQFGMLLGATTFRMEQNSSKKFESGLVTARIEESPSIMFSGMEGSVLGIIVAHGEGRFVEVDVGSLEEIERAGLIALRYTLPDGTPTEEYPFNPNGSRNGIAAVTTPDGRKLWMMPHHERLGRKEVWPWMPREWEKIKASPWLTAFANAFDWCKS